MIREPITVRDMFLRKKFTHIEIILKRIANKEKKEEENRQKNSMKKKVLNILLKAKRKKITILIVSLMMEFLNILQTPERHKEKIDLNIGIKALKILTLILLLVLEFYHPILLE